MTDPIAHRADGAFTGTADRVINDGSTPPSLLARSPRVLVGHGGGGRLTQQLIEEMFLPAFGDAHLAELHDGAVLSLGGTRVAISTDSFVVTPLFFPGGDIGELAVNGTVNDLAMCGAIPQYLTLGLILEEGLPMETLWRVVQSIDRAARRAGVSVVTGDTKVVEHGREPGLYINTAGIGVVPDGIDISPRRARPGDVVLLNGAIAIHGTAVMSVREGLDFETSLESDTAPLAGLVGALLAKLGLSVHTLRDPTRGGVATALNEIASSAGVGIEVKESAVPVWPDVAGACEILGLEPLYIANEGKVLVIVDGDVAEAALDLLRQDPLGAEAVAIGRVVEDHPGRVVLHSTIGGSRVLDLLSGEQLPRIC